MPGITTVTGSRELGPADELRVELGLADHLAYHFPDAIRFGGARGTDTVALRAAHAIRGPRKRPYLAVVVPGRLRDQPAEARAAVDACADEVLELGLPLSAKSSYHARNRVLIEGYSKVDPSDALIGPPDRVFACWNGRRGGTLFTITLAETAGIPVEIVELDGIRSNPRHHLPGADVYVSAPYVSARTGKRDSLSEYVRRSKALASTGAQDSRWGSRMAEELVEAFPRRRFTVVIPVPRRTPDRGSGMAPLVAQIAGVLGVDSGIGMLQRIQRPEGGVIKARRERNTAAQHARSMSLDVEHPLFDPEMHVVLVDNVIATGGTMAGAIKAIRRDAPRARITGLALTGALEFEPEKD